MRLRGLEADHQRAGQARAVRGGDGIELVRRRSRASRKAVRATGHQIAQMLARGQFRHHAAVFGVQADLRGNDVGQNAARRARPRRWFRRRKFRRPAASWRVERESAADDSVNGTFEPARSPVHHFAACIGRQLSRLWPRRFVPARRALGEEQ